MGSKLSKTIRRLGSLSLLGLFITVPRYSTAVEVTEAYPNGIDSNLQEMWDRLCAAASAGDTINIDIAAGVYTNDQVFTMCDKAVNVRLIGAGIGATIFKADNLKSELKIKDSNGDKIVSDRQFGPVIVCSRAYLRDSPDGNTCDATFGQLPASTKFKELCLELAHRLGPYPPVATHFTPFETFCQVKDLSVEGVGPPPSAGQPIPGPGTPTLGISGHWNRLEIADVEVSGFYSQSINVSNSLNPEIHHAKVRCALKVNPNGSTPPGIQVTINSLLKNS